MPCCIIHHRIIHQINSHVQGRETETVKHHHSSTSPFPAKYGILYDSLHALALPEHCAIICIAHKIVPTVIHWVLPDPNFTILSTFSCSYAAIFERNKHLSLNAAEKDSENMRKKKNWGWSSKVKNLTRTWHEVQKSLGTSTRHFTGQLIPTAFLNLDFSVTAHRATDPRGHICSTN